MGPAVLNNVDSASISPGAGWAWVSRSGHSTFIRGLYAGAPAELSPNGLIDAVDRVAWARNGSVAVLYSSSGGRLQRVRISASDVVPESPIDSSFPGHIMTLAVGAAGQIVAGIAQQDGGGLYAWNDSSGAVLLASVSDPAMIALSDDATRVFVIDNAGGKVLDVAFPSGTVEDFSSLTDPSGNSLDVAGLAVSADNRYVMLSDRATLTVRVYDTTSRTLAASIPLDFAPSRAERFSADPLFVLNTPAANEWLLILDARGTPRVYVVPAPGEPQ
jgi:DNA-binding beta-propeller fold protein YncE